MIVYPGSRKSGKITPKDGTLVIVAWAFSLMMNSHVTALWTIIFLLAPHGDILSHPQWKCNQGPCHLQPYSPDQLAFSGLSVPVWAKFVVSQHSIISNFDIQLNSQFSGINFVTELIEVPFILWVDYLKPGLQYGSLLILLKCNTLYGFTSIVWSPQMFSKPQ